MTKQLLLASCVAGALGLGAGAAKAATAGPELQYAIRVPGGHRDTRDV